jgi:hypothetical protein
MQPNMPAPLTRDGGPVQGLPAIRLAGMKRNQPLAMMGGAASSVLLPGRTLNRHPRKADEATRRKWLQAKARRHCGDQKMTCHFPVHRRPVKGRVNQITHCLGRLFPVRVLAGGGFVRRGILCFCDKAPDGAAFRRQPDRLQDRRIARQAFEIKAETGFVSWAAQAARK